MYIVTTKEMEGILKNLYFENQFVAIEAIIEGLPKYSDELISLVKHFYMLNDKPIYIHAIDSRFNSFFSKIHSLDDCLSFVMRHSVQDLVREEIRIKFENYSFFSVFSLRDLLNKKKLVKTISNF